MASGRFFTFDTEVSTDKYAVFRYNRLQKKDSQGLPLREQYPIYVAINDRQWGFYINSYEERKYNHELFSFPLLNDASSDKQIDKKLEQMFNVVCFEVKAGEEDRSTLKIIKNTEGVGFQKLWAKESANNGDMNNQLKKSCLLLDFLFDFKHTDVFQSSSNWQLVNARIHTNTFLSAILAKGEWLYWRGQYTKNNLLHNLSDESYKHISDQRFDADERWIEVIVSEAAPQMFLESDGWFDASGDEMRRVLYGDIKGKSSLIKRLQWLDNFIPNPYIRFVSVIGLLFFFSNCIHYICSLPFRDFSSLESFSNVMQAIVLLISLYFLEFRHKKTIDERQVWLKCHFRNEGESSKPRLFNKIRTTRNRIYHFFFNRFDFDDGYLWFMSQLSLNKQNALSYLLVFSILNLAMCFQFIDANFHFSFENIYFNWKRLSILSMCIVFLIVIVMPTLFILEMQFQANKNAIPSIFHPGLTLPKTSLAMLTGWLVWVPIAEEAWKLNANAENTEIISWLSIMLALAIVFIFFTLKGIQPELIVGKGLTGVTFGVVVSGYAFAFGWGVLTTQFTCRQALDEPVSLMTYVFGKTEVVAAFTKDDGEKSKTLQCAIDFNETTDSTKVIGIFQKSIDTLKVDSLTKVNFKKYLRKNNTDNIWEIPNFSNLTKNNTIIKQVNNILIELNYSTNDNIKALWLNSIKESTIKDKLNNLFFIRQGNWRINSEKLLEIIKDKQNTLVGDLIDTHAQNEKLLPSVVRWKIWFSDLTSERGTYIYIFPRMLLINSGIAFFLGFFAQIAFQSAGYKEPI